MKLRSNLYKATIFFMAVFLTACKYDTDISNPEDYVKVYMPQAIEAPAKRTFVMADTLQTIIFGAAFGGPISPSKDIEVAFEVNPALVGEFNSSNGTNYEILPQNSYTLEKTSSVIKKGTLNSSPLKIKLKTRGALEAFKQYLLPISIGQVSSEIPINESLKTSYFLVEAQREGITLKVMSYGKGSGIHNMSLAAEIINAHNPDIVLVREMDSMTVRSGKTDGPSLLAPLIGMPNYVYVTSIASYDGGKYGATIYSKYPFTKQETHMLPTGDTNTEKGPLGIVTVQLNDNQKVVFAGTHLNANATRRAAQTPVLIEKIKDITDPFIIVGNFNDRPPAGPTYAPIISGAGLILPCATCPPNTGTSYSDFIMYKPANKFNVVNHSVGTASTSAHMPVITQFTLYKD